MSANGRVVLLRRKAANPWRFHQWIESAEANSDGSRQAERVGASARRRAPELARTSPRGRACRGSRLAALGP